MKTDFVKTALYVYPMLKKLSEAVRTSAENKALLSYRAKGDAFDAAAEVADTFFLADRLDFLREAIGGILSALNEDETFLLEYKYFRRKKVLALGDGKIFCSERNYFRRQGALLKKIGFLLALRGVTEQTFLEDYAGSQCLMRVYRAISEGKEEAVVPKRRVRSIVFQRSAEGAALRPRTTKTAMTITAADTRQITTISATDSPPFASSFTTGR